MTNKRTIAILSAIIVIVGVFAACNQHTKIQTEITTQIAVTEVAVTLSEDSAVSETVIQTTAADTTRSETRPVRSDTTTVRETTSQKATTTTTQTTMIKETTTKKARTTEKAPATSPKTTIKKETTTNRTGTATKKSVDAQSVVNYAISYGKSIGLSYDSSVSECWDNPIKIRGDGSTVKRDVKSRLNRYKNVEGFEYFSVWSEKHSDGDYDLYIAYA